jgi:hypothetical protein
MLREEESPVSLSYDAKFKGITACNIYFTVAARLFAAVEMSLPGSQFHKFQHKQLPKLPRS